MTQITTAFLIFTFFALGGLIVDLGLARHTQHTMAIAADSAALEGARLENTADDATRRQASREALTDSFDDDFGVTASDARNYGAGPLVGVSEGETSMHANAQVQIDPAHLVYDPDPQLNLPNARYGDMVEGRYDMTDEDHAESSTYQRSDFEAGDTSPGLDAFLVRLRRTDGSQALDAVPGVSSRGPTLPFLFGRGSLIDGASKGRGITVRATSIAAGRRATLVGPADPAHGLTGSSPFLLEQGFWNSIAVDGEATLAFGGDGELANGGHRRGIKGPPLPNPFRPTSGPIGGPPIIPPGQMTGGDLEPLGAFANRSEEDRRSWSLGDPVIPVPDLQADQALTWLGNPDQAGFVPYVAYVPIYDGIIDWDGRPGNSNPPFLAPVENRPKGEGPARVVGFGAVLIVSAERLGPDVNGDEVARVVMRKLSSRVAPLNASSVSTPGLLPAFEAAILARYQEVDSPLRAAALVR